MKQRLMKLFAIACMFAMLTCLMAGCGKPKTNDTSGNFTTETGTGNASTQKNTEEKSTEEDNTEEDKNSGSQKNTEPESTDGSKKDTEAQEASGALENESESDLYLELANTLAKINNVQAGSAGTSLRTEEALSALTAFVNNYGANASSQTIRRLTEGWAEAVKEDYPTVKEDFAENLYSVTSLAEANEPKLYQSDAWHNIINGINEAMGIE